MTERSAPPRPHYPIWIEGTAAGEVVSGTQSPSLNIGIGLGYVPAQLAKAGNRIEIEIRGKRAPAEIVPKPIYRKPA
jgi:aminomethyltransferase